MFFELNNEIKNSILESSVDEHDKSEIDLDQRYQ